MFKKNYSYKQTIHLFLLEAKVPEVLLREKERERMLQFFEKQKLYEQLQKNQENDKEENPEK